MEYWKLELENWTTKSSRRGSTNLIARVTLKEKNICFSSMYQEKEVYSVPKARLTNPFELTGLEVWGYRGRTDRKVVVGIRIEMNLARAEVGSISY